MKKQTLLTLLICITLLFSMTGCSLLKPSGDFLAAKAVEYYNEKDYEAAIDKMLEAEKAGLDEVALGDVYSILGHCYLELERIDEAFSYYEKALEIEPDAVEYIVNIAIAYRQIGNYDKAMELYQKALEIDPDYPELNVSLGALYVLENEPETAIPYFEKAIELDPTIGTSYGNAALAYAMIGDFEKADEYIKQSIIYGYENASVVEEKINALKDLE